MAMGFVETKKRSGNKYLKSKTYHFANFLGLLLLIAWGACQKRMCCQNSPREATAPKPPVSLPIVSPPSSIPATSSPSEPFAWISEFAKHLKKDPHPPHLARNSHFWVSNEDHQDRFYDALSKRQGGVYIGVGADQNYLMAGWCKPEVMVPLDFDQGVVDLHQVYRVFFLHAATPQEFVDLWSDVPGNVNRAKEWIAEAYGKKDPMLSSKKTCQGDCKRTQAAYVMARKLVWKRLQVLQQQYQQKKIPIFLTDNNQYQHIVNLFAKNRVFPTRGDLSQHALGHIATGLHAVNQPLGVLYLSNSERYFSYLPHFKPHMLAMPVDPHTLILHTWALRNKGNLYAYFTQSGTNFKAWLKQPTVTRLKSPTAKRSTPRRPTDIITPLLRKIDIKNLKDAPDAFDIDTSLKVPTHSSQALAQVLHL